MHRSVLLSTLLLAACDTTANTIDVRVYGEELIESGIPAEVFVDGWAVDFDKFLVTVGEIEVTGPGASKVSLPDLRVYDLTQPSDGAGHQVALASVIENGRYDDTQFVIAPGVPAAPGNASSADMNIMRDGGYSLYVAGQATRGDVAVRFAWGFATATRYTACESQALVDDVNLAKVELTIHGDHLFYDDLFAAEPNVSFDLIAAADADGDGEVTQAELTAVDLRPLPNYQVGSTGITDLWRFIEHQTTTLGHIDGEGHCEATPAS